MPPGPTVTYKSQVVALLDSKSFPLLFDVLKVEKNDIFTGTYIPSLELTGNCRILSYLDPSEPKQRRFKNLKLIASENFTNQAVMEAVGSCLTNNGKVKAKASECVWRWRDQGKGKEKKKIRIPWDTDEKRLKEYFRKYGEVVEVVIMRNRAKAEIRLVYLSFLVCHLQKIKEEERHMGTLQKQGINTPPE
ncbi:hypothetical protein ACFX12_033341 [Malus domestica]